jgi:hypothetical protein
LHHGKYDCPMAKYLSERVMMNGDFGDDEWSDGMGDGWARYGRFLLFWDDRGFVGCDKFPTVAAAIADRDQWLAQNSEPCERCGERLYPGEWECDDHECQDDGPLVGTTVYVKGRAGVAWRVTAHFPITEQVEAHMVGNDRTEVIDVNVIEPLPDGAYCVECGQIGCTWHTEE